MMFADLRMAAAGIALAIAVAVGATGGWSIAWLWAENWTIPSERSAAREAGITEERVVWQERSRRAELKAEQSRRTSQAAINQADAENVVRERIRDAEMVALNAALQEKNDAKPVVAGAAACPAAIPRRLSVALGRVGAAAPGQRPGKPDGGLP